ncbi:hypothetical protein [Fodinibius sp. AD559]|uniref:hypothetical protein n=1 Tax=Fodinibius sp. AD559 TaxID=3424179 RepID=UPI0040469DAB
MSGPEFIVAIVAIGCITGLIKKWMDNRYSGTEAISKDELEELQQTFDQHKNKMQKRVQNLEAIVADEDDNENIEPEYRQIETSSSGSSLNNDLKQKDRVRS